jgi:hypothetical protein
MGLGLRRFRGRSGVDDSFFGLVVDVDLGTRFRFGFLRYTALN